jgi:hypothetical protein
MLDFWYERIAAIFNVGICIPLFENSRILNGYVSKEL